MPNHQDAIRAKARSNYRQARLTFTAEVGGRLSYSLYAKGLNDQWNEHHCLVRDHLTGVNPPESLEDVVRLLIAVLQEQTLPGIG